MINKKHRKAVPLLLSLALVVGILVILAMTMLAGDKKTNTKYDMRAKAATDNCTKPRTGATFTGVAGTVTGYGTNTAAPYGSFLWGSVTNKKGTLNKTVYICADTQWSPSSGDLNPPVVVGPLSLNSLWVGDGVTVDGQYMNAQGLNAVATFISITSAATLRTSGATITSIIAQVLEGSTGILTVVTTDKITMVLASGTKCYTKSRAVMSCSSLVVGDNVEVWGIYNTVRRMYIDPTSILDNTR